MDDEPDTNQDTNGDSLTNENINTLFYAICESVIDAVHDTIGHANDHTFTDIDAETNLYMDGDCISFTVAYRLAVPNLDYESDDYGDAEADQDADGDTN